MAKRLSCMGWVPQDCCWRFDMKPFNEVWVRVNPTIPVPMLLNDTPAEGDSPCVDCPDVDVCSDAYLSYDCHIAKERG